MTKNDNQAVVASQQQKVFTQEVRGTQYTYYLTGAIVEPEEYVDLCNILRSCSPQDEVIIRINSRGGYVSSERMIVNAIRECQGTVKGFIEYDCMSAATGVFLACHQHGWGEHIQFMAHCSWWGAIGKNPDIKSQTEFGLKQMEEEINTTYAGLLTEEELRQCNDGKEFWFGAEELGARMQSYYEYLDSIDHPESVDEQEEPELDLFEMIQQAVRNALNQSNVMENKVEIFLNDDLKTEGHIHLDKNMSESLEEVELEHKPKHRDHCGRIEYL